MAELTVIGTSHHTAPLAVREALALGPDQVSRLLAEVHAERAYQEALLLSTCNRTEFYFVGPSRSADPAADLLARIARVKGTAAPPADPATLYRHTDTAAVRHLFRVAASLDSQLVGESEILGQVKRAYRLAVEARTASFLLHRLLHWAFRVGKRVRTETALGDGAVGVPQAAVDLAGQIFARLADKTVLVVGAGETAEAVARALLAQGVRRLLVANRTPARAERLADALRRAAGAADEPAEGRCPALSAEAGPPVAGGGAARLGTDEGAASPPAADDRPAPEAAAAGPSAGGDRAAAPLEVETVGLDRLVEAVERADLVITSTGAAEPILTEAALGPALRRRRRPLMLIDIAVPRDAEPCLARLESVYLYDLDDLDALVARNLERRRAEIPLAEAIVEDEVAAFERWRASRRAAPTIRLLRRRLDGIGRGLLQRYAGRFPGAERAELEAFVEAFARRVLHHPIALLKHLATDAPPSERMAAVDLVRRLFDLDALEAEDGPAPDETGPDGLTGEASAGTSPASPGAGKAEPDPESRAGADLESVQPEAEAVAEPGAGGAEAPRPDAVAEPPTGKPDGPAPPPPDP